MKAIDKAKFFNNLLANKKSSISTQEDAILIKSDRKYYKIKFIDINYIEALKDYVIIYTSTQRLITAMNLKTIHKKLPLNTFYRVSKSYIINKEFIDSYDHTTIYINEIAIPIGNTYKESFLKKYGDYFYNKGF